MSSNKSQIRTLDVKETVSLFRLSGGDARKLLNALELIINSSGEPTIVIDNAHVLNVIQKNLAIYDKKGEMHYDIISAFIKSMRGSDPNAAVYWLARLIEGTKSVIPNAVSYCRKPLCIWHLR